MSSIESARVSFEPASRLPLSERMRLAVDRSWMRDGLTACLPVSWGDVLDVAVVYVAAVPGTELRAWYRVKVAHRDGTVGTRDLSGFIEGAIETKEAGRSRQPGHTGAVGHPDILLPQLGMHLWEFPADPHLSGLPRLVDMDGVRALLAGDAVAPGDTVACELVRYVPGKRAMLRFAMVAPTPGVETPPRALEQAGRALFCKVYRGRKAMQRAAQRYQALWEACGAAAEAMPTPRPVQLDADTASLWLEGLPGKALDASAPNEAIFRVGVGLAALHGTGLHLAASWSPDSELGASGDIARLLEQVDPETAEPLRSIGAALDASIRHVHFGPVVPCHGSFRINHILWDGRQARLLDLDSAVNASPWLDVANLWTHLHSLTCQGTLAVLRAQELMAAFRAGYESRAPWAWNPTALDWFRTSLLVRKQAYKCVKHLHTDAGTRLPRLLNEALARATALPT